MSVSDPALKSNQEAADQGNARSSLPFTFAKQFGVLLDSAGDHPIVVHQGVPRATVLAELRRHLGTVFELREVSDTGSGLMRLSVA